MEESKGSPYSVDMSPGTQGSSELGRVRPGKSERTRRSWSLREEEILLTTLKELVVQGWKSDNGFRAGYLSKVEEAIRREFPSTDLRVNPNIISKIATWKKNYYSLQGILSRSGVGFNLRGDHMVDCDAEQWDQIIKVDPNARSIRNKRWLYWDSWTEIFGKDRANGSNAEDIMEAVNELCSNKGCGQGGLASDMHTNLHDSLGAEVDVCSQTADGGEDSVCEGFNATDKVRRTGRKRKDEDGVYRMCELLSKMHDDNNARLESISERIGYEVDLRKARQEVFDILGKIAGLSLEEKFDICDILVKESERLDLFMGLPEDARPAYVSRILRSKKLKAI